MRALLIAVLIAMAHPAYAQGACGNRADIVKRLAKEYKERVIGQGIAANGSIVEVYRYYGANSPNMMFTHYYR